MYKKNRIRVLERLIKRLEGRLISMERSSNRFSWLRLVVFFGGVAISAIFFFLGFLELFFAGLVITFLAFLLVAAIHRRMDRTIEKH
jgi:predicted PurR-regulated permease PerM